MLFLQANLPIGVLIFIVLGAAAIGFILYRYRDVIQERITGQKRRTKSEIERQIEENIRQIQLLKQQQNYRDGAILIWKTLGLIAYGNLGIRRSPAQTARQFAVVLTSQTRSDPRAIIDLVKLYEKARYSDIPITDKEFEAGISGLVTFYRVVAPTDVE